jgi:IS1 family transposase
MSSFNTGGAFSGGEADGLRSGIEAAMKVMGQNTTPNYLPPEVSDNHIQDAAMDVAKNSHTIEGKNSIIKTHFEKIETKDPATNQSLAAFEREVMKRIGG